MWGRSRCRRCSLGRALGRRRMRSCRCPLPCLPDHSPVRVEDLAVAKATVAPRPRASLPHRGRSAAADAGALAITDEGAATGDGSRWPLGHPERARLLRYYGARVRAVASASRSTPGMVSERYAQMPMSPGEPPSARHTLKACFDNVLCGAGLNRRLRPALRPAPGAGTNAQTQPRRHALARARTSQLDAA